MKKLIALCLCLLLAVLLAVPAFARDYSGNGYTSGSVIYNGKAYGVSMTSNFSSEAGAYTCISCSAAVKVYFGSVTVTFDTTNNGYVTERGGSVTRQLSNYNQTVVSGYVRYTGGMSRVVGYTYITGSATLYGDSDVGITVSESK